MPRPAPGRFAGAAPEGENFVLGPAVGAGEGVDLAQEPLRLGGDFGPEKIGDVEEQVPAWPQAGQVRRSVISACGSAASMACRGLR